MIVAVFSWFIIIQYSLGILEPSQIMQILALVNSERHTPFKGGKGVCIGCKNVVIAVCGTMRIHHWRHESGSDCDSWSESIGPWHVSWQDLVLPEFMEVIRGNHRADIIGNNNIVVELQHSSISSDDIRERESFYGDMVWLFDATFRFSYLVSGGLVFFSLGKTKHINECKKKVFLDFGDLIVEVVTLELKSRGSYMIKGCHGFGYARSKKWFVKNYLSEVKKSSISLEVVKTDKKKIDPWINSPPFVRMKYKTKWYTEEGKLEVVPEGTAFFSIKDNLWKSDSQPTYLDFILKYPDIGGGWSVEQMQKMLSLLNGRIVVLRGRLCIIPSHVDYMEKSFPYNTTIGLIVDLQRHIQEGRIPILKQTTFDKIMSLGRQYSEAKGLPVKNTYKSEK